MMSGKTYLGRLSGAWRRVLASIGARKRLKRFEKHECSVQEVCGPAREDYVTFVTSQGHLQHLRRAFAALPVTVARFATKDRGWLPSRLPNSSYEALNRDYVFRDCDGMALAIEAFLRDHIEEFHRALGSDFRAVNVRAWTMNSDAEEFGPSAWHQDGFLPGHMKAMIYLEGLGGELGGLELLDYGELAGPEGLVVLFRNSDVLHRAIPGESGRERPVIEITVQRTLTPPDSYRPLIGDNNDRHLSDPYFVYTM